MSKDLNRATLMGNLTRAPEIRYSEAGNGICFFDLAVGNNAREEAKKRTCFTRIIVLGKFAEVCNERLRKGSRILVEGKLRNYSREIAGSRITTVEVLADQIYFLDKREKGVEQKTEPVEVKKEDIAGTSGGEITDISTS